MKRKYTHTKLLKNEMHIFTYSIHLVSAMHSLVTASNTLRLVMKLDEKYITFHYIIRVCRNTFHVTFIYISHIEFREKLLPREKVECSLFSQEPLRRFDASRSKWRIASLWANGNSSSRQSWRSPFYIILGTKKSVI